MGLSVVIINANYPHYEVEKSVLAPFDAKVSHVVTGNNLSKTIEAAQFADAIMTRETELPRQLIDKLENCKVIVRYGVGVDNIDLEAAARKKIYVANVKDYGTETVAEHAIALMFAVARRVVSRDRSVRNGRWDIGANEPLYSFVGKTVGIVGCGRIGKAFLRKISSLGFAKILVYDPYIDFCEGAEMTDLATLFESSDVISLHLPLSEDNKHLINEDLISRMKKNSIIINTSRGALIDEKHLIKALEEEKIFGAGLDVFESEPPPLSHPLFSLENVVVSDHTGWYSVESLELLQRKAAEEVARVFSNQPPLSWVNRWKE
ncbi:MAG: C-terminal binding protein [Clostridiales bacterium]|nr:C-terminal binding protein [Clostridiales bacterium]